MAARIVRRQALLVKVETTEGTDIVPATTDAVRMAGDGQLELGAEVMNDRSAVISGLLDKLGPLAPAARFFKMSFPVHLRGPGVTMDATHLPELDAILQAAGMSSTLSSATYVYDTASTGLKSVSCYFYLDGKLWKGLGCHAEVGVSITAAGPGVVNVMLQGILVQATDTSFATAVYAATAVPPVGKAMTISYNSVTTLVTREFGCSLGNVLAPRLNASATDGLAGYAIVDRASKWNLKVEDPLVALADFETDFGAGVANARALSVILGSIANNIMTFTIDKATVAQPPRFSSDRGISVVEINGDISMEGTNRLKLVFS
jgi:hypothetical protein